ncbi:hypothetical protein [Sodalis praecaptivus]|uniref:hypothetical protein n=1 Tax=Sodalis praecaptivus TaxID=1239307 RepID=UPI00280AB3DF|nr:hypothetical protein [Sodalis praecaptivus]
MAYFNITTEMAGRIINRESKGGILYPINLANPKWNFSRTTTFVYKCFLPVGDVENKTCGQDDCWKNNCFVRCDKQKTISKKPDCHDKSNSVPTVDGSVKEFYFPRDKG